MGRKMLTCEIGDVFGCFEVISKPVVKGEHSFVQVQCTTCGHISELTLSEIKNRPKKHCTKCRGHDHIKYLKPNKNTIIGNWQVVGEDLVKNKGFRTILCKCLKCNYLQYIRLDALYNNGRECEKCHAERIKVKESNKTLIKNRIQNQPFVTKFNRICNEAGKRSIPVTITPEYIKELYEIQEHKCALTGDYLPDVRKASLDRIDSTKPYEPGNVQFVTKEANLAKHIMPQEVFIDFCKRVVKHANQQPSQGLTTLKGSETNDWNSYCKEEYLKCMNDFEYFKAHYIKIREDNIDTSAQHPIRDDDIVRTI